MTLGDEMIEMLEPALLLGPVPRPVPFLRHTVLFVVVLGDHFRDSVLEAGRASAPATFAERVPSNLARRRRRRHRHHIHLY